MPKTFVINADDEVWVKQKVASIREELRKMIPDGARFEETVLSIITRERHYVGQTYVAHEKLHSLSELRLSNPG